jgi:hypothetical protein
VVSRPLAACEAGIAGLRELVVLMPRTVTSRVTGRARGDHSGHAGATPSEATRPLVRGTRSARRGPEGFTSRGPARLRKILRKLGATNRSQAIGIHLQLDRRG